MALARYYPRQKAEILEKIAAVEEQGDLEARIRIMTEHELSEDELLEWRRRFAIRGVSALRTTRTQNFR
jgi:hypothetical protein